MFKIMYLRRFDFIMQKFTKVVLFIFCFVVFAQSVLAQISESAVAGIFYPAEEKLSSC